MLNHGIEIKWTWKHHMTSYWMKHKRIIRDYLWIPENYKELCYKISKNSVFNAGSGFLMLWIDEQLQYQLVWKTSMHKDLMQLPLMLMQFICHQFGRHVQLCTEYVREEFVFRCHPCYQSNRPILIGWMLYLDIKRTNQKRKHALVAWPLLCCAQQMKIAFNLWFNVPKTEQAAIPYCFKNGIGQNNIPLYCR